MRHLFDMSFAAHLPAGAESRLQRGLVGTVNDNDKQKAYTPPTLRRLEPTDELRERFARHIREHERKKLKLSQSL